MIKEKSISLISEITGRLDKAVVSQSDLKRSVFDRSDTLIFLNGSKAKKSSKVRCGDRIEIRYTVDVFEGLKKEDIPLDVIYEDDDMLVINKDQGLVVHPGCGVYEGTLANALYFRYGDGFLSEMDEIRPGIVHRLDKDTSGVMVAAKNDYSLTILSEQFKERETKKWYLAIAKGFFKEKSGIIEKNIARDERNRKLFTVTDNAMKGKSAKTEYRVLKQYESSALLLIRLYTGRTHQIRVHLKSIGHPIVGDSLYSKDESSSLMLHSYRLLLKHPRSGEEMDFKAPVPQRFSLYLDDDLSILLRD